MTPTNSRSESHISPSWQIGRALVVRVLCGFLALLCAPAAHATVTDEYSGLILTLLNTGGRRCGQVASILENTSRGAWTCTLMGAENTYTTYSTCAFALNRGCVSPDDDEDGYTVADGDCDDTDDAVNPGSIEVCDGVDNDCRLGVDTRAVDAWTWYEDADGDTFGDATSTDIDCDQPIGYVADSSDCDDTASQIYPGALELCDGMQNDCHDESWSTDAGLASFEAETDGSWSDLSTELGGGALGVPVAHTLSDAGTLSVCEGTWYVSLSIEADVAIEGRGEALTVLSGGGVSSVVKVQTDGVIVTLSAMTLEEGDADETVPGETRLAGGGMLCNGASAVRMEAISIESNAAEIGGGVALYNGCVLTTRDTTISANTATSSSNINVQGGGLFIYNSTVEMIDSVVSNNVADSTVDVAFGGGIYALNSDVTLDGTEISENSASSSSASATGSGLYVYSSTLEMANSSISNNSAESTTSSSGGGLYIYNSTVGMTASSVSNNSISAYADSNAYAYGGGLYVHSSIVELNETSVTDNSVATNNNAYGGGLYIVTSSEVFLEGTEISENAASASSAAFGGGFYVYSSTLEVTDSSVSDNAASNLGGGLYVHSTADATGTDIDFSGNAPEDIYGESSGAHTIGAAADFSCSAGSCL